MSFTNTVEQKKLEQVNVLINLDQLKLAVMQLLQLHRFGLLDDDDALLLINGYVIMYEEAQDVRGRGGRSRY